MKWLVETNEFFGILTTKTPRHEELFLATDYTAFARLAFFGKVFFPKRASSKYHCLAREGF
jgi:hypothetical protein